MPSLKLFPIGTAQIANSAITTAKIADATITFNKFINARCVAGDTYILAQDTSTEETVNCYYYVKMKEVTLSFTAWADTSGHTLRIIHTLCSRYDFATAYSRIYKNDSAVGPEHSTNSTSYVTFTDDIANWGHNNKVQLYVKAGQYGEFCISAFTNLLQIKYDITTSSIAPINAISGTITG